MNTTLQAQYEDMWIKLQHQEITETVWKEFCMQVFAELLEQPEVRDIMVRLKHR